MRCTRCYCWIYLGFEVYFRHKPYHELCAVEAVREAKPESHENVVSLGQYLKEVRNGKNR